MVGVNRVRDLSTEIPTADHIYIMIEIDAFKTLSAGTCTFDDGKHRNKKYPIHKYYVQIRFVSVYHLKN